MHCCTLSSDPTHRKSNRKAQPTTHRCWRWLRLAVFLLAVLPLGCVSATYQAGDRTFTLDRMLSDTGIESIEIHTPDGATLVLKGYTSDQSKLVDALLEALAAGRPGP